MTYKLIRIPLDGVNEYTIEKDGKECLIRITEASYYLTLSELLDYCKGNKKAYKWTRGTVQSYNNISILYEGKDIPTVEDYPEVFI